jgi:hypothetical protein
MAIFTNSSREGMISTDVKDASHGTMDVLVRTMLRTAGEKMTTNGLNSWMSGAGAGHADWN